MNGQSHEVLVEKNGGDYRVTVGDTIFKCVPKDGGMLVNNEFLAVRFDGSLEEGTELSFGERKVSARVEPLIELEKGDSYSEEEERGPADKDDTGSIVAPMPGKIIAVKVKVGSKVEPDSVVLILEAMKMQNDLLAGRAGTVKEVRVKAGDVVEADKTLVVLE
jgi:3-methylcrotonyl-CoA carboxylase alpha subunit